jgi:hypothetical protein
MLEQNLCMCLNVDNILFPQCIRDLKKITVDITFFIERLSLIRCAKVWPMSAYMSS